MAKKEKDAFWQIIRGICILAVIMIHCPNGLAYPESSADYYTWVLVRQFINFPVAIFIFLSGYFTNSEKVKTAYKDYLIRRGLVRLFIPFLIWSILYTFYNNLILMLKGEPINWAGSLLRIAVGKAATPFYYILVLLQLLILTPLFLRFLEKRMTCIPYLLSAAYLVFLYIYVCSKGQMPPLYATVFLPWAGFYMLGIQCRQKDKIKITLSGYIVYILPALMIILELAEAFVLKNLMNLFKLQVPVDFVCSQLRVSSYLYAAALILLFIAKHRFNAGKTIHDLPEHNNISNNSNNNSYSNNNINSNLESQSLNGEKCSVLAYIGNRSYGLFYIHCMIINMLKAFLSRTLVADSFLAYFLTVFVLALIISLLIIEVVRKAASAAGKEDWLKYIGFN